MYILYTIILHCLYIIILHYTVPDAPFGRKEHNALQKIVYAKRAVGDVSPYRLHPNDFPNSRTVDDACLYEVYPDMIFWASLDYDNVIIYGEMANRTMNFTWDFAGYACKDQSATDYAWDDYTIYEKTPLIA